MSTQTEQRPLVERLREGCIINPKRWSGDPGEPSPVNESATEELLMEAADEIERLQREVEGWKYENEGLKSLVEAEREIGMDEAARAQAEAKDWQERYYDERFK